MRNERTRQYCHAECSSSVYRHDTDYGSVPKVQISTLETQRKSPHVNILKPPEDSPKSTQKDRAVALSEIGCLAKLVELQIKVIEKLTSQVPTPTQKRKKQNRQYTSNTPTLSAI